MIRESKPQWDLSQSCWGNYWAHIQIRQADTVRYLDQYLHLQRSVVIYSPPFACLQNENHQWLYACDRDLRSTEEEFSEPDIKSPKVVYINSHMLPFSPSSIDNIIVSMGTPLGNAVALINECYTALKSEGFLLLFYPNNSNVLWHLSPAARVLKRQVNAPKTSQLVAFARQCQFELIEHFTFSLIPPIMLKYMPPTFAKWDDWCYNIPVPIGQCSVLILQKKTISPMIFSTAKKKFNPPLKVSFETRNSD